MSDLVISTLRRLGPCVSPNLVAVLVKEHGLTAVNARQLVSRATSAKGAVKKLAYLPFPRNARFVYLQESYGSPQFWNSLTRDLLEHTASYGGALAALLARGGMMPLAHFPIACGSPTAQKGHISPATVLDRLTRAQLVQAMEVPGIGTCLELAQKSAVDTFDVAGMRARLRTESVLLGAIKDWARKLGLVSYGQVAIRDEGPEQPRIATLRWDLTAPSYVGALLNFERKEVKPGFLACDVLLGVNVSAQELQPFINKCKTLRMLSKVGRCLQIFIADGYTKEAYRLAKEAGIVPATTDTLFGAEVARALRQLTDVLKDVFPRAGNMAKVDELFKRLSHIEGAANNLRGALFEYLVAETVGLSGGHTYVRMNELLRDPAGRPVEVDVLFVKHDDVVRFIECKGYQPGGTVPDQLVDRWLTDRIPLMRAAAEGQHFWKKCRLEFEFWTTGRLTPEATEKIAHAAGRTQRYGIRLVDRDELERRVADTNNTGLKRTLKEHFLAHPLELAESATRRPKRQLPIPPSSQLCKRGAPEDHPFIVEGDDDLAGDTLDTP